MTIQKMINPQGMLGSAAQEMQCLIVEEGGTVAACNPVASRMFDGEVGPLIGRTIADIRHPDMPKALSDVIQDRLDDGRCCAEYQLRVTPDGQSVWMLTLIVPSGLGHLVLNLTPRSEILERVAAVYEKVRAQEADLGADAAKKLLRHSLAGLGFTNHEEYMSSILATELEAKGKAENRVRVAPTRPLKMILQGIQKINKHVSALSRIFARTAQVPTNMRLQANMLEGQNGPISVVSDNHRVMTQQMEAVVLSLQDLSMLGERNICAANLEVTAAQALRDLIGQDTGHKQASHNDWHDVIPKIRALSVQSHDSASERLLRIAQGAKRLSNICLVLRRQLTGLEMSRMMCEIERAKLNRPAEGLTSIVATLGDAQSQLEGEVVKIESALSEICLATDHINKRLSRQSAKDGQKQVA